MSFAGTDFGHGGHGLSHGETHCANDHLNTAAAKFCATCGVAMPVPNITQHERIDAAKTRMVTCPQGHVTEGQVGPAGNWCCAVCWTAIDPAQFPVDQGTPSLSMGMPVTNDPYQRSNSFGAPPGAFPYGYAPDERDRPQVMFLWLWWFIFNPVVLFLAPSYAGKAKRLGFKETGRYWVPFWFTLIGYAAIAVAVGVIVSSVHSVSSSYSSSSGYSYTSPTTTTQAYSNRTTYPVTQESGNARTLADVIAADTQPWKVNGVSGGSDYVTTTATCESNTQSDVAWQYNCNISFANGSEGSYWVDYNGGSNYTATRRLHS